MMSRSGLAVLLVLTPLTTLSLKTVHLLADFTCKTVTPPPDPILADVKIERDPGAPASAQNGEYPPISLDQRAVGQGVAYSLNQQIQMPVPQQIRLSVRHKCTNSIFGFFTWDVMIITRIRLELEFDTHNVDVMMCRAVELELEGNHAEERRDWTDAFTCYAGAGNVLQPAIPAAAQIAGPSGGMQPPPALPDPNDPQIQQLAATYQMRNLAGPSRQHYRRNLVRQPYTLPSAFTAGGAASRSMGGGDALAQQLDQLSIQLPAAWPTEFEPAGYAALINQLGLGSEAYQSANDLEPSLLDLEPSFQSHQPPHK